MSKIVEGCIKIHDCGEERWVAEMPQNSMTSCIDDPYVTYGQLT